MYMNICTRIVFWPFLGNAPKAWTSREAREVIEETSLEVSFQEYPNWLEMLSQKFSTRELSESSNSDSQAEKDVHQKTSQSSLKPLKGSKSGGVKKAKYGNKKQIERWDFFDPTAAFVSGILNDALKPSEVEKITCYRKLIGNTRGV